MNGIKMSDCRFYVNEAERTIVCVIPNTKDMVIDFIIDNFMFPEIDFYYSLESKLKNELEMPNTFMGKAVCSPDDEWDEVGGKLIAFSRAKDKCYKSFFKRANHFVRAIDRRLENMIETFNDFGMKLEDKREALQNEINDRLNINVEEK